MFRFVGGLIERVALVVSALLFAQLPLFMQQYEQQMVGRIAELKLQVDAMQIVAGDRSLSEYLYKFTSHPDSDFANQGELLLSTVHRFELLTQSYMTLQDASPFAKPFLFLTHIYPDIAASTWDHFKIGLPLNPEGGVYALVGVLFGMLLAKLLRFMFLSRKSAEDAPRTRKIK